MNRTKVLVLAWLPDGMLDRFRAGFANCDFIDGREPGVTDKHLPSAVITYGLPPIDRLDRADSLRWIQLISAGVPQDLCPAASPKGVTVTNLSGLYGPSIAEHALAFMSVLARNLHRGHANQLQKNWDRNISHGTFDLRGRTLGVVGLGNIGQSIARLARGHGMRVI